MFHGAFQGRPVFTRAPSFSEQLSSDGMRAMLRYWVSCRAGRSVPQRPAFEPTHLPELLPHIQLHERKEDGRYLCRVSGTAVVEAYGFESSNRYVGDVINPANLRSRVAILDESLLSGRPIYYEGSLVLMGCDWKGCNRLVLPLADADGRSRFILSVLDFSRCPPQNRPIPGMMESERHGVAFKVNATETDLAAL